MKHFKFICIDDKLIFGFVEFHFELLPKEITMLNDPRIKGGGIITVYPEENSLILGGKSSDFGKCKRDFLVDYFRSNEHLTNVGLWNNLELMHNMNIDDVSCYHMDCDTFEKIVLYTPNTAIIEKAE